MLGAGGSRTDNHILKMLPYDRDEERQRFIADKDETLKRVGSFRSMYRFIAASDGILDADWWSTPYRGDVKKPGQHVANRAMALSTTMLDLLLLGCPSLDALVPGDVSFLKDVPGNALTAQEQATLHFLMLSHFVADACMPCHCDGRDLSDYAKGLHKEMEKHWSAEIAKCFDPKHTSTLFAEARAVDSVFGLAFAREVPGILARDVWLEVINLCRASFAIASVIADHRKYPYAGPEAKKARAPYARVFPDDQPHKSQEFDRVILHDAVLNVAMVWKHVWTKVAPSG